MDLPAVLQERLLAHSGAALGPRTTLGVGGPAPWVLEPRTREELMLAVSELRRAGLPFRMLGHGSNLIVGDAGVPEVVIHTRLMQGVYHHGEREDALRVEAGASLVRLISICHQQGLSGLEGLMGIPGTVGGAVVGNAGGRHGWIADRVVAVTIVDDEGGATELALGPDDFGYRCSPFKAAPGRRATHQGAAVLDVVLQLERDDPETIFARMSEVLRAKRDSQPLAAKSAGCIFRNTDETASARLIQEAGCKGMTAGAAQVSERHSNFILNQGGALAADVLGLVDQVRARVRSHSGAELELEVEVWGADPESYAGL